MTRIARRVLVGLLGLSALAAVIGLVLVLQGWPQEWIRREAARLLESRFDARATVESVSIRLFPTVAIEGRGLRLDRRDRPERVPLVLIRSFRASGSPWSLLKRRVDLVEVFGLELHVAKGVETPPARGEGKSPRDVTIGTVRVVDGLLVILPNNPEKLPLRFLLREVSVRDFRFDAPVHYDARLINPKPEGTVLSVGRFGPWNAREPRRTPLAGGFELKDARLSTFKGIAGTLDATGTFDGTLEQIDVSGQTTTPDFRLDLAGHPVPLTTVFRARVDGTNGDTYLDDVQARLGETPIVARGAVVGEPGAPGRTVSLDVRIDGGRLENVVRLTVRTDEPFMTAGLAVNAKLVIPPGERDVVERLSIAGAFRVTDGHFESDLVQQRLDGLSRRGCGEPENMQVTEVPARFDGRFAMNDGVLRLPRVSFGVRGATVGLAGSYALRGGRLDFTGQLRLDAPVSRTVTGFKSWALKLVDPLFRRDGAGTVLPIRVGGTVEKPTFGVDIMKALTRR